MSNKTDKPEPQMKSGDFCHVELPVKDKARAKSFYGEVFGWHFNDVPDMDYTLFQTPGGLVGGGLITPGEQHPDGVVNYLLVDSIEETAEKVEAYGGKKLSPKVEVPGHGWLMQLLDSEGNVIAIWKSQ